jgi:release factor glutamine methyltransferase
MSYPTKRISSGTYVFDVYEEVYEPAEDSFLFVDNLEVHADEVVLDLGTGSGILAVLAAKTAGSVVAVDLNPYAIRCAKENAKHNRMMSKISFLQSDLFSAFAAGTQFDVVLFNAPYLPSEKDEQDTWIGRSWAGGANGRKIVDRFIAETPRYLKLNGRILLMQSTLTGIQETLSKFNAVSFEASIKAAQKLPFFETLTLIEAKRNP